MIYVHHIDPFLIRFPNGWFIDGIRWYGVSYLLAFIFAIFAINFYTSHKKSPLTREQNFSVINYIILGVLLGGRIGYMLLYDFTNFVNTPQTIFYIWRGGMSSHGGFVGVAIAMAFFCKKYHVNYLTLTDIFSTIAPFGFFCGRIANFINGELHGRATCGSWGVIFPCDQLARHPSQLYEALLEGCVLFLIVQFLFWRKKTIFAGEITGKFLVCYAIFRFGVEFFREPDAGLILGLTRGQFYSIFLVIIACFFLRNRQNRHSTSTS